MAQRGLVLAYGSLKSAVRSPSVISSRSASLANKKEVIKPPPQILERMSRYQVAEATTHVHVVEGAKDQIGYRLTFGLCMAGLGGFTYLAYELGFRK